MRSRIDDCAAICSSISRCFLWLTLHSAPNTSWERPRTALSPTCCLTWLYYKQTVVVNQNLQIKSLGDKSISSKYFCVWINWTELVLASSDLQPSIHPCISKWNVLFSSVLINYKHIHPNCPWLTDHNKWLGEENQRAQSHSNCHSSPALPPCQAWRLSGPVPWLSMWTPSSSSKEEHHMSAVTLTPLASPAVGIAGMSQLPAQQLYISLNGHEKCSRSRNTAEKPVSGFNANTTCLHGVSSQSWSQR